MVPLTQARCSVFYIVKIYSGVQTNFREIEGHRLELRDINCFFKWLKLTGQNHFQGGVSPQLTNPLKTGMSCVQCILYCL